MSASRQALVNRLLVVVFGVTSTAVAFLASTVPGPITQICQAFGSTFFGPLLGIFLIGGISRHANKRGALIGGIFDVCINCWLVIGSYLVKLPPSTVLLPPVSVDGCKWNGDLAVNGTTWMYAPGDHVTFSDQSTTPTGQHLTSTEWFVDSTQDDLPLLAYFYGISYIWFTLLGATVSGVVGVVTSLMLRDRDADARVEKRLLIPFHLFFSWSLPKDKDATASDDDSVDKLNMNTHYVD